jgi:choline dehydrogenase-like flavoprotein
VVTQDGLVGRCLMEHLNVEMGTFILEDGQTGEPRQYYTSDAFVSEYKAGKGNVSATVLDEVRTFGRTAEVKHFLENLLCEMNLAHKVNFIANFSCPGEGVLSTMIEQYPNAQSRLSLLEEKDELGVSKANVNWVLIRPPHHPVHRQRAGQTVRRHRPWLRQAERVRLRRRDTAEDGPHAHHMGTTRMAASAQYGVVDRDCKVFGTDNLYVAGSSIFATGGASNPTMPLLQFALRLADHLDERLKSARGALT